MQTNPKREQLSASYDWYRQIRETQPVFFDQNVQASHIFSDSTLKKVSFPSGSLWSNSNRAIKSISFDGAMMDKVTYAALKGMAADLSKVTVLS